MEADEDGVTAKNTYGGPLFLRTEFSGDSETTYEYLYNAHGDVVMLLSDGDVVATYDYDSFGNILNRTGDVDNSILYAGYQYDEETGLYYVNARMYDPVTASFLQMDTYAGNVYDPLSLNLYTYCLNNPHKYVDPSGHFAITAAVVIGAVIWGLVGAAIEYKLQKDAGGMIDYNQVLFQGVLNAGIALISGGLANGAMATAQGTRMTVGTFGKMMLAEAGLGIAEGVIGETGYQLINGTKVSDLDAGRIVFSGVQGGISGAGGALVGEGIGAGMKALKNSRMVSKVTGQVREYANVLKGSSGSSRLRQMDLQFFAGDEVYQSGRKIYASSSDITKEVRLSKPLNSPDIDKWFEKKGTISIDENDIWTYHDWEGNSVSYASGYPDFKSAGMVRQEALIGSFVDRNKDFARARELGYIKSADGTWHHHEDGMTLQEVETILHNRFRHRGGISNLKRK